MWLQITRAKPSKWGSHKDSPKNIVRPSARSIERITDVHRDTIMRLMVRMGKKCEALMKDKIRDFHSEQIQVDEIWTFIKKKESRLRGKERFNPALGDQYVFVALDANTKLIPCFVVGKRNTETALKFIKALKEKMNGNGRFQLSSDGFKAYITAVEEIFGADIDYAQLIKVFASDYIEPGRYAPPKVTEVLSKIINGNPNPKHICKSFVERQNLTMRMQMRQFTRLTNAFSKKLENLTAALSLHFAWYNFGRIHQTLRVTPAMEAGVTDHIWGLLMNY